VVVNQTVHSLLHAGYWCPLKSLVSAGGVSSDDPLTSAVRVAMTSAQFVAKRAIVEVLWHQSSRSYEPTADNTRAHSGRLNHPAQTTHDAPAPGRPAAAHQGHGDERRRPPATRTLYKSQRSMTYDGIGRHRIHGERTPHTHTHTHGAELEFRKGGVSQSSATGISGAKLQLVAEIVISVKIMLLCQMYSIFIQKRRTVDRYTSAGKAVCGPDL